MGMLRRIRDMRDMVEAAPGMVAQAQQLSAQAQQTAAGSAGGWGQAQRGGRRSAGAGQAERGGGTSRASTHRTVTITGMRQIGMLNFDLLVEFDLTVLPDGQPPYPAVTQQCVSQMQIGKLAPGVTLQAAVDPSNPAAIWLDLESFR